MSADDFKIYQQAVGFNYEPFGLLFTPELESHVWPRTQYVHDWMHTLVAGGVFQTIFTAWLDEAQQYIDIYKQLAEYLDFWVRPKARKLSLLFGPKRKASNKEAGIFKCDASDALSLCPIIAYYIQKTFMPSGKLLAQSNVSWIHQQHVLCTCQKRV